MTNFEKDHASARRHLGVAMIDLAYAAADLRICARGGSHERAARARMAADLLQRELDRLQRLCDMIGRIGTEPSGAPESSPLVRWWPALTRGPAHSGDGD